MVLFTTGSLSLVFREEWMRHARNRDAFWGFERSQRHYEISTWFCGVLFTTLGFALMFDLL